MIFLVYFVLPRVTSLVFFDYVMVLTPSFVSSLYINESDSGVDYFNMITFRFIKKSNNPTMKYHLKNSSFIHYATTIQNNQI